MFRVGPNYSYIISDNVTFYVPFQGVLINSNYQDFEDFGTDNYDRWDWGLDLTPTIALILGKIQFGVGLNIIWIEGVDKINTNISVDLGYCF